LHEATYVRPRFDAVQKLAEKLPKELDWMKLEDRWLCTWNSNNGGNGIPLIKQPPFDDILKRIKINVPPPQMIIPKLPSPLPKIPHNGFKLIYPWEPSSRIGIGVLTLNNIPLTCVDILCSSSLIYALSGDAKYTQSTFYL
jgi:hypothetical protein